MYTKKLFFLEIPNIIILFLLFGLSFFMFHYSKILALAFAISSIIFFALSVYFKISSFKQIKNSYSALNGIIGIEGKDNIKSLPVPVLVCNEDGSPVFYNDLFGKNVIGDNFLSRRTVAKIVSTYYRNDDVNVIVNTELFQKKYSVFITLVNSDKKNNLYVMYFIDDTYYKNIENSYNESRPVVITVSIDSVEEASDSLPHSLFTSFFADTEKMITEWFSQRSCIFRKIGDDRFFAVTESKYLNVMIEERFDIMDKVRNYKINNKSAGLSLSIGVGTGADVCGCENFSKQALEMARGRGGDQTAIKNGENYQFFGGVSQSAEKNSQVRSRTVAKSIEKMITDSSHILIMGHKNSDLDSLGASVGLAGAVKSLNKKVNIVVNYDCSLAKNLIDYCKININEKMFISTYEAQYRIDDRTLLIIVDTMRNVLIEDKELYENAKNIIVTDHHRMSVDHISNAQIFYHEPTASSTCEMITELIQYMPSKPLISKIEAECLLAGIYLDTKNFTLKTGVRTFESCAYLKDIGADTVNVRKMFSTSFNEYETVNNIVSNAEIKKNIAFSFAESDNSNIRVCAAKAADNLLELDNIDASFVVFDDGKGILNVSARSYGKINVQLIMEQIGGGGHLTMAAAQLENMNYDEIRNKIIEILNKY